MNATAPSPEPKPALAATRQARLARLVRERQEARLDELIAALGASAATVRRDLAALEERGELRRVHGGAVATGRPVEEPLFDDKTGLHTREKRLIAEAAARLAPEGARIYLDGGSTVLELARLLRGRSDLTIATHSLRAAMELAAEGPRLIVIGGELRRRSQTLVGPLSERMLEGLHMDWAFMGTIGLDERAGMTTTDPAEAFTKRQVIARAGRVALLCDASKFGQVSFVRAGRLEDVDVLVTDRPPDAVWRRRLRRATVRCVVAGRRPSAHVQ